MDIILRQCVVIIVDVTANTIENRGEKRIEAFAAAEDAGGRRAAIRSQRLYRDVHRRVVGAAERTTDDIEHCALGFMMNILRNRIEAASKNIADQLCRDRHDQRSTARVLAR